ncbi:MAG: hypothetical protein LPK45_07895, partial [Bacteroidota bacterium]|nr:hypothetical protein [Bacteroidota bacterium]MDX5430992.1 hypothetical protein [Bacteroidota bacterium]MDX5469743.1 hypothetical protein [Bacteroidota bacterium]
MFLLFGQALSAQEMEWSNLEKFRNKTSYNRIIGSNQYGYYVIRGRDFDIRRRVIIERYRESLSKDFSKEIPERRGEELVDAFVTEIGVMLWKSAYNEKSGKLDLFVEMLDENAEPRGPKIPMSVSNPRNYSDDGDFAVFTNQAQTHFVVLFSESAPKGKSFLHVQVFNRKLERISTRKELLFAEEKEFEWEQVLVDSAGNAFVLVSQVNPEFR